MSGFPVSESNKTCSKITAVLLLCTEDDNSCYRNVCKMSVVSFALAVVFIIKLFFVYKYSTHRFENGFVKRKLNLLTMGFIISFHWNSVPWRSGFNGRMDILSLDFISCFCFTHITLM